MTITRYTLATQGNGPFALVVTAVMAGFGIRMLWTGAGANQPLWYRIPFWAAWFSILSFIAYRQATSAREIVVHENDEIEFVSMLGRVRVPAQTIQSIRATGGRYNDFIVRHQSGTLHLAGSFNEFHRFLSELEHVNPGVEVSGC
jgi:hypothetical protein